MGQFLRDNWFVVVIAIVIIGFVSYFICLLYTSDAADD